MSLTVTEEEEVSLAAPCTASDSASGMRFRVISGRVADVVHQLDRDTPFAAHYYGLRNPLQVLRGSEELDENDVTHVGDQLSFVRSWYRTLHEVCLFYALRWTKKKFPSLHVGAFTVCYHLLGCLLCAAAIAAAAQVSFFLPNDPQVPVTLQTLGVLLSAVALGPVFGPVSVLLYLLAGIVLPVYANHSRGFGHLKGATSGYLWGFLPCAAITGYASVRGADRSFFVIALVMAIADLVIYIPGLIVLHYVTSWHGYELWRNGFLLFLPGDLLKCAVAAASIIMLWRGLATAYNSVQRTALWTSCFHPDARVLCYLIKNLFCRG